MNVFAKREEAKNFFQRDRRTLHHECYVECCTFEEVREHYEFDIERAVRLELIATLTIEIVETVDILN